MKTILRALGFLGKADKRVVNELHRKLPEINSFVDVAIGGSLDRESVPVNDVTQDALLLRYLPGLDPGVMADFLYTNSSGRYRFRTVCRRAEGNEAYLDLPATIKTIEQFSARRMAERIPWVTQVQWRYAPDGCGFGEFLPASMMDVSRGGASLVVGREVKVGSQVEARFVLNTRGKPFLEVCQVMRAAKIGTSERYGLGIRFVNIDPPEQRMLIQSLEERRSQRRLRGVV
jgi:hypothetical protein